VRPVVDRTVQGKIFSKNFGYPLHTIIPIIALQSSPSIIQAGTINGRAAVTVGIVSNPAPQKNNLKNSQYRGDMQ
jgi:hypothetical protein